MVTILRPTVRGSSDSFLAGRPATDTNAIIKYVAAILIGFSAAVRALAVCEARRRPRRRPPVRSV